METFNKVFAELTIDTISSEELKEYLEGKLSHARNAVSLKTWNNRRGFLSIFYKYCLLKKHVAMDPVIYVPQFKIQKARGTAAAAVPCRRSQEERKMQTVASARIIPAKT